MALLTIFGGTAAVASATPAPSVHNNGAIASVVAQHSSLAATAAPATVSPNIQRQACTAARATWFHLYTTAGTWCYGFTGTTSIPSNTTLGWCWGNNFGTLYFDGNGNAYALTITGWSGNATCP